NLSGAREQAEWPAAGARGEAADGTSSRWRGGANEDAGNADATDPSGDDREPSTPVPGQVIDDTENLPHRGIVDRDDGKPLVEPPVESLAAGLLRLHAER